AKASDPFIKKRSRVVVDCVVSCSIPRSRRSRLGIFFAFFISLFSLNVVAYLCLQGWKMTSLELLNNNDHNRNVNLWLHPIRAGIKMLKRGYLILIVGAALFIIGIILTATYGMSIVSLTLSENIILADVSISPSKSINHTIEISDTERPVSLVLHIESELNDDTNYETPSEPLVEQIVINPNGFKVNQNQIGRNGQSDLFTSFRPQTDGIYTLTLSNLGTDQVKVQGIFGYLPITEDDQVNLAPFTGVLAGAALFIIGIITLIAGTIFTILDRRREKNKRPIGFRR
ncbi:MAG: hypothetical protein WCF46_11400, partial [Nitrososphaeraceae archaeon]